MKKRKIVAAVMAVVWMGVIFSFSARPSEVSTNDSNRIGFMIGRMFVSGFEQWPEEEQMEFAKAIDHPVRKTAHALEYAILGGMLAAAYIEEKKKGLRGLGIPWAAGTLYAASDEFHQLFVPGRSCQISDVALDSTGVFVGVLAITLIAKAIYRRRR